MPSSVPYLHLSTSCTRAHHSSHCRFNQKPSWDWLLPTSLLGHCHTQTNLTLNSSVGQDSFINLNINPCTFPTCFFNGWPERDNVIRSWCYRLCKLASSKKVEYVTRLPGLWPWARYSSSLSLALPICKIIIIIILGNTGTSGQDCGIGKHGSNPCTTTSKLQPKYRTTIIQNCWNLSWMEV